MTLPELVLLLTCGYITLIEYQWHRSHRAALIRVDAAIVQFEDATQGVREIKAELEALLERAAAR